MTTKLEQQWLDIVSQLPCATCGAHGVQIHHARENEGMGERASNYASIPLCIDCHTGPLGIHGDKTMLRIKKWTELDALYDTIGKAHRAIVEHYERAV